LVEDIREQLREILTQLCEWLDIQILEGFICDNHVHMYLAVPPKHAPSYVMKILKGKSSELLRKRKPRLPKRALKWNMWARGFFVTTVGIDREIVRRYVRSQEEEQIKEEAVGNVYFLLLLLPFRHQLMQEVYTPPPLLFSQLLDVLAQPFTVLVLVVYVLLFQKVL